MALVTALDADPSYLDQHEQKFVALIREHGWHNTRVFEGDNGEPAFSYTTGFVLKNTPEFIVFSLKREIAHAIFWDIFRNLQSVEMTVGVRHHDVANFPHYLFNVADRFQSEYLGWSRWFYGKEVVPTLQSSGRIRQAYFLGSLGSTSGFETASLI